jgi:hypothetical protein
MKQLSKFLIIVMLVHLQCGGSCLVEAASVECSKCGSRISIHARFASPRAMDGSADWAGYTKVGAFLCCWLFQPLQLTGIPGGHMMKKNDK